MSRYIDADYLIDTIGAMIGYGTTPTDIWEMVNDAPTIDAVSVVRCKECKHKYQEPWDNGVAVEGECEIWHNATLDDDFCSYGEREGE